METNESILVRNVVGLDDRRVIGKMRELRVNCRSEEHTSELQSLSC